MRRSIIPYKSELKPLAQKLRNNSTKSEILMWQCLKAKQLGTRFIRQKPLGDYIVDFFSYDYMLAIEVDGYSHSVEEVFLKDQQKEKDLLALGVSVLRINDKDVFEDIEQVIRSIQNYMSQVDKGVVDGATSF